MEVPGIIIGILIQKLHDIHAKNFTHPHLIVEESPPGELHANDEVITRHDLHISNFSPYNHAGIESWLSVEFPTPGLSTQFTGDFNIAKASHQRRLALNPNYLYLVEWTFFSNSRGTYPDDSDFWLRDANGEMISIGGRFPHRHVIDFMKPHVQDKIIDQIVALSECGLFDGVMFDEFGSPKGVRFAGRDRHTATDLELTEAITHIFREARSRMRDDFLIIINGGPTKPVNYAEYINGSYMEIVREPHRQYNYRDLAIIEDTLLWNEENLQHPKINCMEGFGLPEEPPDGPNNQRWMRVFTTLTLTHSDGYTLYNTGAFYTGGSDHEHIWYDFWDADLGQPVGGAETKGQLYDNRDGVFIREFTNGWAVYNRSGQAQNISLPIQTTGVASGATSFQHTVPDLDGEMFLKTDVTTDLNADGVVNIQDLVIIANAFGKAEPDLNGDGVVNIQDLVIVANAF